MKNIQEKIKQMWVQSKLIEPDEKLNWRHWIALCMTAVVFVAWVIWKTIQVVIMWCIILVYALMGVFLVVAIYKSIFG